MAVETTTSVLMEKLQSLMRNEELKYPKLRRQVQSSMEELKKALEFLKNAGDERSDQTTDGRGSQLLSSLCLAADRIDILLIKTELQRQKAILNVRPLIHCMSVQTLWEDKEKFMSDIKGLIILWHNKDIDDDDKAETSSSQDDQEPSNSKGKSIIGDDKAETSSGQDDQESSDSKGIIGDDNAGPSGSQDKGKKIDGEDDIVVWSKELHEFSQLVFNLGVQDFVISVEGVAGCGKTTFVRKIYNSVDIKQKFQLRAWVQVSNKSEERDLLIDILKQVTDVKDEERLPIQKLRERACDILISKRYLVVLDDAPATEAVLNLLSFSFPITSDCGRVILTSSDDNVIRMPGVVPFKLRPLNDEESWKLFSKKVQSTGGRLGKNLIKLKENILRKCNGLPIAIVVLGGLLSTKKSNYKVLSRMIEKYAQNEWNSETVLTLSYEDLPSRLKPCLLYLGLFPKTYKIPTRRLFLLWQAEGLVNLSTKDNTADWDRLVEDQAKEDFEELAIRNLIEVERRLDGSPKSCQVPGALYDALFPKTEDTGLFHVHRNPKPQLEFDIRRVAEHLDVKEELLDDNSTLIRFQNLRSYISFRSKKGDTPSTDGVDKFLRRITAKQGFGLLSVLDLERVYKPMLSNKVLGRMLRLRYLGLRWTFLDSISDSVGNLPYLEALDVKHTNITSLPISIWKSKRLRHLYMNIHLKMPISKKLDGGSFDNLQTLVGVVIGERSPGKDWLGSLTGLRKLGLTCHERSIHATAITEWISRLTNLQSLRLRSINKSKRPADLPLESMPIAGHGMLSDLYLLGKLQKIDGQTFPPKLKMLTLSVSKLTEDPMPILGQLLNLKVIRLFRHAYMGKKMSCSSGGFPQLRVLKLWVLEELETLTVDENSMPRLNELEIRRCDELKETEGLNKLASLKELTLTNMSVNFHKYIEESMPSNVVITVNNWKFPDLPDEIPVHLQQVYKVLQTGTLVSSTTHQTTD